MKKPIVLITDRFSSEAIARLRGEQNLEVRQSSSHKPTSDELKDVSALIVRSRTKITRELLENASELRVIVTSTSGFDHIDLSETQSRKIIAMHTPEANAQSAAELTWLLVLGCARRFSAAQAQLKTGDWQRDLLVGEQLFGKTYGVVGLGRIGSRVARFAKAFGMQVIAFDPYVVDDAFLKASCERVALDELLRRADFASLHVPATNETNKMIGFSTLENANPDLCLINTSRGDVINEPELIKALDQKIIRAVGLDVFAAEPLPTNSPLLRMSQVLLTPHLGATTSEAFYESSMEAANKIIAFFRNGSTADTLPPLSPWFSR